MSRSLALGSGVEIIKTPCERAEHSENPHPAPLVIFSLAIIVIEYYHYYILVILG